MKIIFVLFCLLSLPHFAFAKLKVVTTTTDLAYFSREVGGDFVEVTSLIRGSQDPHYIEPKPSYVVLLNKADLFIQVGLSLEIGWVSPLLIQSRNRKIQSGQPGHLYAHKGLKILEIPHGNIDRSQGDIHPEGNPHYWLDPRNGIIIAGHIADKLSVLDPEHAAQYQQNNQRFQQKLQAKITQWETQMVAFKGKEVIAHHNAFSYFSNFSGLHVVDYVEPKPGIPPSASHLVALVEKMKNKKISMIITENYFDPNPANKIAKQTGAKVLILPTSVGGDVAVHSYDDLFTFIITKIGEVL